MNDSSFYGGKQGFSFIIVKNFASVEEMVNNFKLGADYTAVHYDEHVLINTEHKNNPENGMIFRRGYDYTNEKGGAIYVGTIVGPSGPAPHLEMTTIGKIDEMNANPPNPEYDRRYSHGEYAPIENLIPGKVDNSDGSTTYNDSIEFAAISIRDEFDTEVTAYIGFKFPYMVLEYTAESVDPYYNRSDNTEQFKNKDLVKRTDDKAHPYYQKWHFSVPKGIKGDSFKNFRIVKMDSSNQSDIDYGEQENKKSDDVTNNRDVLVYDYYHYDKDSGGEPKSLYLGDYNMIDDVLLAEDGTITIVYTHDDDTVYNKAIKWIKSVTLDQNGKFTVNYNHETDKNGNPTKYEVSLSWVDEVLIEPTGEVKYHLCNKPDSEYVTQDKKLKWVKDIAIAGNGTVTLTYNDNTTENLGTQLKWVTGVLLDDNGIFTISFNQGDTYSKTIKFVEDMYIQTEIDKGGEGSGDQRIHIKYNTVEDDGITKQEKVIGNPINYIMDMKVTELDHHLVVYYSDPAKRKAIKDANRNYPFTAAVGGKDDWLDLGTVKDEDGLLVGLNIATDYSISAAINYLNTQYENGLQGDLKGKVVTVGTNEMNKRFYAFDYSLDMTVDPPRYKGWFYLGTLDSNIESLFMIRAESDPLFAPEAENLDVGGIWFIIDSGEDAG